MPGGPGSEADDMKRRRVQVYTGKCKRFLCGCVFFDLKCAGGWMFFFSNCAIYIIHTWCIRILMLVYSEALSPMPADPCESTLFLLKPSHAAAQGWGEGELGGLGGRVVVGPQQRPERLLRLK